MKTINIYYQTFLFLTLTKNLIFCHGFMHINVLFIYLFIYLFL